MPTQEELNRSNSESIARQRESRSDRAAERAVKDRRKELLSNTTSSRERREIKSGIYDLDTQPRQEYNKEGTDERIQNDGIDRVSSTVSNDDSDSSNTFTLDVVTDGNVAGTASFVGGGVQ